MRTQTMAGVFFLGLISACASTGVGAEFSLVPIDASGVHTIVGNEIILEGGGQRVFLDVRLADWDPDLDGVPLLRAFQAALDSSGYTSGLSGGLTLAKEPCAADLDCRTAFGGVCSLFGAPCVQASDCDFPAFETCQGSQCAFPTGIGGFCEPGYILTGRSDYVFVLVDDLPAVDLSTPDFRYASATQGDSVPDPGVSQYVGSLVLDVPAGARGTFVVGFKPLPSSLLQDENNQFILPLDLLPARITIACVADADCSDGSICTDDVCQPDGTCANTPTFDDTVFCCNPTDGTLTAIDDGNECTDDVCQPADGTVTHDPRTGQACGDPSDTECDNPDLCDATGTCRSNFEAAGFPCGDPGDTDCTDPDTCDGAGVCQPNDAPTGFACGDPGATDCTDPDTCDGAGVCQPNDAPDASPCDDGRCCIEGEACLGGVCTGGSAVDCGDGLACTTDTCDEGFAPNCCINTIDPGHCVIGGVCYADGDLNPANDCEECNSTVSPSNWSLRPAGSACDDGDACTGTGRPGIGGDTCDGAGTCAGVPDPQCNDDCDFAVEVFEGVNTGNNDNRGPDDAEASCQPDSNNDVWFRYTASCDGTVFLSTTGSLFGPSNDPVLSVYDACPSVGGAEIACDDDSGVDLQAALTFQATAATTYWLRVAGFEINTGDIVLNISTVTTCLIDGICYPEDAVNPANECEACLPDVSTTQWSPRIEGSPCGDPADTECDSPDACDGAGTCEVNPKPDGTECTDDGNDCTFDVCQSGACVHPSVPVDTPCGDGSDSECDHPDTCDNSGGCQANFEPSGAACGDPSDTQCDHPDVCDGAGLCNGNLEPDGTVCDDGDVCTGGDACAAGVCTATPIPQAPVVTARGPRALAVTPAPLGSPAPVALLLTSPDWPCLHKYVSPFGLLVDAPVFQLPDDWGTVFVRSQDVIPSTPYNVEAECGSFRSAAGSATTSLWGDIVGAFDGIMWTPPNGVVDVNDLTASRDAFQHEPTAPPLEQADLWPCTPDRSIDILDIVQVIDAFGGFAYPCPFPCSPIQP